MVEPRCFVAVTLSGPVLEGIGRLQRDLKSAAPRGAKVEPIPRRYLHITLDDLGPCPPDSDEAVALAVERLMPKHSPFKVGFGGMDAFPEGEQPRVVYARLNDEKGRLAALREALHSQLVRYGFGVDPRPFHPHVAVARVDGLGPMPALDTRALPDLRVAQLALYKQTPVEERGPRYRPAWTRTLVRFPAAAPSAPDDTQIMSEITRQLDERLAHHAHARPRLRRRRTAIDEEE